MTQIGRDAMLLRLLAGSARWFGGPLALRLTVGGISATCLATMGQQLISLLGTSPPVSLALAASVILAIVVGTGERRLSLADRLIPAAPEAFLLIGLAAWVVVSPGTIALVALGIGIPGVLELSSAAWNSGMIFAIGVALLGTPAYLGSRLAAILTAEEKGRSRLPSFLLGAALGLFVWGFGAAQVLGPYTCALAVAGLAVALAAARIIRRTPANERQQSVATVVTCRSLGSGVATSSRRAPAELPAAMNSSRGESPFLGAIVSWIIAGACGGMLAAIERIIVQVIPGTIYVGWAEVIGLCVGMAAGIAISDRPFRRSNAVGTIRDIATCGLALWGIGIVALFPVLVRTALGLNAYVSDTVLLLAARSLISGLAVVPIGLVGAVCLQTSRQFREGSRFQTEGGAVFVGTLGYVVTAASGIKTLGPDSCIVVCSWLLGGTGLAPFLWHRITAGGWRRRGAATAALALLAAAPFWQQNFDPRLSARLLFSTGTFSAYRNGVDPALLPYLDEGREIATRTGSHGTLTVWRYGGEQLQIRENGIPKGIASTSPDLFPRFVPETLQTALPLILHERPAKLLVLGLGTGESLSAALTFPIQAVTCQESDQSLQRLVRDTVVRDGRANPLDDERVTLVDCDPALGLRADQNKYDVIVSSPDHAALIRSQPYFTAEFYRTAAERLAAGGVFCQRLQFVDLGPQPLRAMAFTMQTAFEHVLAIEIAPGEMLFAATNDPRGLVRPKLVWRLETPHARQLLSESGLDWSILLNLPAWKGEPLTAFALGTGGQLNAAADSRLAFRLPREVMRWGAKLVEVEQALANGRQRLLDWVGEEGQSPALVRRFSEIKGQQDLMQRYADQYWAYRASLRDQVTSKSRSQIEQVSATLEGTKIHPEDRRRLQYFKTLGRAIKTHDPDDIESLAVFETPYDPLVSYFLHQEIAELYALSKWGDPVRELRHRLHTTWFSSPRDSSLGNVVRALKLLREHPEAEPDPVRRWDYLNALLQALEQRWEARAGIKPTSPKHLVNDIDQTVLAAEATFQMMAALTIEAGLPPELWASRRAALEKNLIRPVRAYKTDILPHLFRARAKEIEQADEQAEPDDDSATPE